MLTGTLVVAWTSEEPDEWGLCQRGDTHDAAPMVGGSGPAASEIE